jgi:tetratricopeptide (TPR) repeat protein
VIGAGVGYWMMRFFWPGVPVWMYLAIALGLHLLAMLWQTLVRREPKPWDPIEPGGSRFDWEPTRRALPASLGVFLLMNLGHFPAWMGNPVLWILYGFLAFLGLKFLEQKLLTATLRRGDLEGGLKLIDRFHFYNPEGGAALLPRGHLLLVAGRYAESEAMLRRAAAALRSGPAQAFVLEFLGDALMEQGRQSEAQRSYQASLAAAPGFRKPYRGMAELALRRGEPVRALEYVEQIMGPSGPSRNPLTLKGKLIDDYWALKAWALAELGHTSEADKAAASAILETNANSAPDLAATYRRLGLAMRAMHRESLAEDYLKKARDANPNGRWGLLAKAALQVKAYRTS